MTKKWLVLVEIIVDADDAEEAEAEAWASTEVDWSVVSVEEIEE